MYPPPEIPDDMDIGAWYLDSEFKEFTVGTEDAEGPALVILRRTGGPFNETVVSVKGEKKTCFSLIVVVLPEGYKQGTN
jgi:hypothetical protein